MLGTHGLDIVELVVTQLLSMPVPQVCLMPKLPKMHRTDSCFPPEHASLFGLPFSSYYNWRVSTEDTG